MLVRVQPAMGQVRHRGMTVTPRVVSGAMTGMMLMALVCTGALHPPEVAVAMLGWTTAMITGVFKDRLEILSRVRPVLTTVLSEDAFVEVRAGTGGNNSLGMQGLQQ